MKRFLAHFDILGYKEFIENNSIDFINQYNQHIFRESQTAVAQDGAYVDIPGGFAPDVRTAEVNCMHFSDTILFWTVGDSEEDFLKLVYVCHKFFWRTMQLSFVVRGALGYGDFEFNPFQIPGQGGVRFYNSSLFGKGLVDVYLKAESQHWAGAFIDETALNAQDADGANIISKQTISNLIDDEIVVNYPVPNKDQTTHDELCFRLLKGSLNDRAFQNSAERIERIFNQYMNGKELPIAVQQKLQNTIDFLGHFRA